MRATMNTMLALGALVISPWALGIQAAAQGAKPALPKVSYAELGKLVRGHQGKVVVVYFWAEF